MDYDKFKPPEPSANITMLILRLSGMDDEAMHDYVKTLNATDHAEELLYITKNAKLYKIRFTAGKLLYYSL